MKQSSNNIPTEKQAAVREKFVAAHRFAQAVLSDPDLKARYEQNKENYSSAYFKAIAEFMSRDI
jgi:hypothetical protein